MIVIKDKRNCSGCHACANACPKTCIEMKADAEGFLYPNVDNEKCSKCGLCVKVCPIISKKKPEPKMPKSYAAYNKDLSIRLQSSSGGIFSLLADQILSENGVVFGAAFNDVFVVEHVAIEGKEDLGRLRVSKYVQSRVGDSFKQAKQFLAKGRKVLFTGTPCQTEGLLSYLGKPYDNLITQDIICHGVPSPAVWEKYVKYREEVAGSPAEKIAFRRKFDSWKKYSFSFTFKDGSEYIKTPYYKDTMMKVFLFNKCLRPACHKCAFKTIERQSDITLADFWGIRGVKPEMDDDKGTSLVIVNSKKGELLFEALKDKMEFCEVDLLRSLRRNPMMRRSAIKSLERTRFMRNVQKLPFEKVVKRYGRKLF